MFAIETCPDDFFFLFYLLFAFDEINLEEGRGEIREVSPPFPLFFVSCKDPVICLLYSNICPPASVIHTSFFDYSCVHLISCKGLSLCPCRTNHSFFWNFARWYDGYKESCCGKRIERNCMEFPHVCLLEQ